MKIAIISPAEIAYRRFMPALQKIPELDFAGVAMYSKEERFGDESIDNEVVSQTIFREKEKVGNFVKQYGGIVFRSYREAIESNYIDAVYIPLPPALHYDWASLALKHGKHVLVEKPSTTNLIDTESLIELATNNDLAIKENYMFTFHNQIARVKDLIKEGIVGNVRLYEVKFGFPLRASNDFRYKKELGGGALLDAGGYVLKMANDILGSGAHVDSAIMNYMPGYDVDMYGSASLYNDEGDVVHISYGMDNEYTCQLMAWGSKGKLIVDRILTAPPGFIPKAVVVRGGIRNEIILPEDDSFEKSIRHFVRCITDKDIRKQECDRMLHQSNTVDEFFKAANVFYPRN